MALHGKPGFLYPLRNSEFRVLWLAELISVAGDQLARVALALVVYARTSSALLTALTYGLTLIPSLLGGVLLSGLADRYPRRRVMVIADGARAVLAGTMAIPGLSLPVLWVCVGLLSLAAGPFKAAQMSVLPQVLQRSEQYEAGLALRQFTTQVAQLAGFAGGGLLLAVVEPHVGMALDAGTFVLSAVLIAVGVRARPAAAASAKPDSGGASGAAKGERSNVVALYALVCLLGLYIVPEGIAAPYGAGLGTSAVGVGLLLAADPVGSAVGAWLSTKVRLPVSPAAAVALAAVAGGVLVFCGFGPVLLVSVLLWAASGALSQMYLIQTQTIVVDVVPDHRRGRVMGRMGTTMYCSQGLAVVVGGVLADAIGPSKTVAAAGASAALLAVVVGVLWKAVRSRTAPGSEPGSITRRQPVHQSLPRTSDTSPREPDRHVDRGRHAGATREAADPAGNAQGFSMQVGGEPA
ncbi:MFS transporter [Amycolatopsis sp. NPDC047767]|uniref:MFS transporter n=1 Tax=Amycolatopsis sp. NPDC047767 TaxID=3156765 RepID=UPI003454C488